jgi:glutathione S-transferase
MELDAPCELVEEAEFPPKLVEAFNPAMQVPTLVDRGRSLFGTRLITEYLLSQYPRANETDLASLAVRPTRPSEHWRDAQVLTALEALLNATVARSYLIWTGVEHRSNAAIPLDLAKREQERMHRLLDWLEGEASPTGFIPEVFSLQDVWLISTIAWTEARIAVQWRGRPKLEAIVQRHANRGSVLTTTPPLWRPDV